jgi:hypothetical protein
MYRSAKIEDWGKDSGYGRFCVTLDDDKVIKTVNNLDTAAQALVVAEQFLEERNPQVNPVIREIINKI